MTPDLDLNNCDNEPIHIPGKVQSHGFLLAVTEDYIVSYCSENIADFIPVQAISVLGHSIKFIDEYLDKKGFSGFFIQLIDFCRTRRGFEPANPYAIDINGHEFNLVVSHSNHLFILEFEPDLADLKLVHHRYIASSLTQILADTNLSELLSRTAEQIQKIIGYDRVMIYKFHEDGHGEVVTEVKNEDLEPLLGLHYPASDIPKQARELYKINLVRLIADVSRPPSDILTLTELNPVPLDLTHAGLRAVSPVHIQYLKNMGVASSFSISILHQGQLWGLVACHNYTPLFINYREREAANMIGQVLSSALSHRQEKADQEKRDKLKIAVDVLHQQLSRFISVEDALFQHQVTLLDAVEASGAALVYDNQLYTTGDTPDAEFIKGLVDWLNEGNDHHHVFETDRLPELYPPALAHKHIVSGLLACRLSKELKEYLLWFRPEVLTAINWAGNPDKPAVFDQNAAMQISPRASFARWSQEVQNTSVKWKNEDVISALQLREGVVAAINRRAAEVRVLNEKLQNAYDELDAFSYTISHDLKNPITTIKSYSQLLERHPTLDATGQHFVKGILNGTAKMQKMINDVLNYSKASHGKSSATKIDMKRLLEEVRAGLMVSDENGSLVIDIQETPALSGDETMMMQVFTNLIGNAVKYSAKSSEPWVTVTGDDRDGQVHYRITDNGIGINPDDQQKIFELFQRSDEVREYEGTGVGLAIVKKIVEKHKGRIWVESEPGIGSTFHILFPGN